MTITIMYAPNFRGTKYMKQTLTKLNKVIESSTIIVREVKSPLLIMCRTARQNIYKYRT